MASTLPDEHIITTSPRRVNQTATFKFIVTSVPFNSLWTYDTQTDSCVAYSLRKCVAVLCCYVFTLTELYHKQRYYWTASFLYRDPTSPRLPTIPIDRHLRYKDLCHCTFPSVIQGPLSLYNYIGILYDRIYPHTPTSSTIHIGLAYVGLLRSSI